MSAVEKFPILLSEAEEDSSAVPPCFSDEGINVRCLQRDLLQTLL
jgi:AP-1 complex subunit mu